MQTQLASGAASPPSLRPVAPTKTPPASSQGVAQQERELAVASIVKAEKRSLLIAALALVAAAVSLMSVLLGHH